MFVMQVTVAVAALLSVVESEPDQNWRVNLKPLKASAMVPMSKDKLTLVQYAADMSLLSYKPELLAKIFNDTRIIDDSVSYPESRMKYYQTPQDGDAIILDDREGYCTIAWRGTVNDYFWLEWADQNLDMEPKPIRPVDHGIGQGLDSRSCEVQKGFYDSYGGCEDGDDPLLVPTIKDFVEKCMANDDKQLVFTGHSQGGAAAGVASIIFENFNPLAITFGQPPFLSHTAAGCPLIYTDHLWRFINSEDDEKTMQYDLVPNIHTIDDSWLGFLTLKTITFDWGPWVGPHIGPSIVLPPGSATADLQDHQTSVRYYPKTEPEIEMYFQDMDVLDWDGFVSAHMMGTDEIGSPGYKKKIDFLLEKLPDGEDLDISGFPKGDLCTHPEDCQTGRCDWDGYNPFTSRNTCLDKVGTSQPCNEDSDCINGNCALGGGACINSPGVYCCAEVPHSVPEGGICHSDIACIGGRCDWTHYLGTEARCQAKVGRSQMCNEHDDCISNDCEMGGGDCISPVMCCNANPGSLANGARCNVGRECASGRCECEGYACTNTICMSKLGQSQGCNEDSDCSSNNCEWGGGSCWMSWCCA